MDRLKVAMKTRGANTTSIVIDGVEFVQWTKRGFAVRYVNGEAPVAELTLTLYVTDLSIEPEEDDDD